MQFADDRHKRAAKMLGYALTLDDEQGWLGLALVLQVRLTADEREALAEAAMPAVDGAGMPHPAFPASFWADLASPDELDAYVLACFRKMSPDRQAAFLDFVQRRAA